MAQKERPSKTYMNLLNESNKELYKFWNVINDKMVGTYELESILLLVLKVQAVVSDDIISLFKLSKDYPGTTITNCSGMPVLTIKLA